MRRGQPPLSTLPLGTLASPSNYGDDFYYMRRPAHGIQHARQGEGGGEVVVIIIIREEHRWQARKSEETCGVT